MQDRPLCVSLLYGAVLAGVLSSMPVQASTVLYTLSDQIPVALPAGVTVYTLDGAERLQARIFGDLPADPTEAAREARRILASPDWVAQQQAVATAWQPVMKAWSLGLEKVPAVVFDDAEVVYGTTNVEHARQLHGGVQP
ncbi:TPA: TIGR03757 family integrating conjugative element protein [Serratia fonticola]